jgi:phosphoribosylanthranilate isomerase
LARVKICGLTRFEDAEFALENGADAIGFVYEPSSPRYIGNDTDLAMMPFRFSPFAVTVGVYGHLQTPVDPCMVAQYVRLDASRLSMREKLAKVDFRQLRPAVVSFRVGSDFDPAEVVRSIRAVHRETPNMHAALLDASDPAQFGGTGMRIDWDRAAEVVTELDVIPVVLAGGLTPDNVGEAVRLVKPYAVDVSSGVEESPGIKDLSKVRDFLQAARSDSG